MGEEFGETVVFLSVLLHAERRNRATRAGGMKQLFGGVDANATLGIFLREFTHGHARQLQAVLRRHLVALAGRTLVLAGIGKRCFVDIDSLLRPVYGHAKQGASVGHTKIAGWTVLRRSCPRWRSPSAPRRRRRCWPGCGCGPAAPAQPKGAASMLTEAINTAVEAGAQPRSIPVHGDSAYCAGKVIAAVVKAAATFSFAIARNSCVDAAIASIPDDAFVPVQHPGAVTDPNTGELISDAQVSEVAYTAFAEKKYKITGRLVVRRVLDANTQDPLFPRWRYHPFFTNNTEPVDQADITHRAHAICETFWSDLIDGPWAHQPSGSIAANAAWNILAAICHNLLRAAGTLTATTRYTVARGATLRKHLINLPARLARPQRRPVQHLPAHRPRAKAWLASWKAVFVT
jgi:Transposase DDE domain group 1